MTETADSKNDVLRVIADNLAEISETLESLLMLLQQREEAFKARKSSGFDRKPAFRKSYDNDRGGDDYGDRKPYRKPYERDRDSSSGDEGGERKSFRSSGPKKSFGDKPAFKSTRGPSKGGKPAGGARKTYKGGY